MDAIALFTGYLTMAAGGIGLAGFLLCLSFEAGWLFVVRVKGLGKLGYIMDAVEAYKAAGHYPPKVD